MNGTCEGKCGGPPNRGVRHVYWCGLRTKTDPPPHAEHDWYSSKAGRYVHCHG